MFSGQRPSYGLVSVRVGLLLQRDQWIWKGGPVDHHRVLLGYWTKKWASHFIGHASRAAQRCKTGGGLNRQKPLV
jgi:hypothetical protein